jgi:hypothetical protein
MFGPNTPGLAPEAHGAGRVEALRLAECPTRLGVVEAIGEPQSLIEERLHLRRPGGDRPGVSSKVVEQRRDRIIVGRRSGRWRGMEAMVERRHFGGRLPVLSHRRRDQHGHGGDGHGVHRGEGDAPRRT